MILLSCFRSILNGSSHTTKCAYHYKNNDGILSRNQLNHAIVIIGKKKESFSFPKEKLLVKDCFEKIGTLCRARPPFKECRSNFCHITSTMSFKDTLQFALKCNIIQSKVHYLFKKELVVLQIILIRCSVRWKILSVF